MNRIVVIGAGISGLAAAWRIRERVPHASVRVLESSARPGGNIWTEYDREFTVELDGKPSTTQLCRDVGLGEHLVAASEGSRKNRYLFLNNRLHQLPASPLGLITTPLLSPLAKVRLLFEPFRARLHSVPRDESVAAFARRRFGPEVANTFIDALVTGIHGGDPEHLSVAAAFPRLPKFEREYGSVVRGFIQSAKERRQTALAAGEPAPGPQRMWSFRTGLRMLVETLASKLPVTLNAPVQRITKHAEEWRIDTPHETLAADVVVLTCPAIQQAQMLASFDEPLAEAVSQIRYTPIAVVVLGYRREHVPTNLDGFGYIAPQHTRRDALGVQWCSSIFPNRAPNGLVLWRSLCGGVNRRDVMTWDDATLLRRTHLELMHTMNVTGPPVYEKLVRWPHAIPQYTLGHGDRVAAIDTLVAKHDGLILGGNAYRGIALNDCTEQAHTIAERVVACTNRPITTAHS
jgi:protoporphyrinogen/coproporphyrinogen III oxidase